jgi:hypothetical protein
MQELRTHATPVQYEHIQITEVFPYHTIKKEESLLFIKVK